MAFSDDFLLELRQRADIESVVSQYVNLKRKGRLLGGLCPFHNEKTPSFYVYPETQSYYCFGCGSGGDVITFTKNIENLDYVEAVKLLCEKTGMTLPQDNFDNGLSRRRTRMYEANREAARFFHDALFCEGGKPARDYCVERQLTRETVIKFGIGFAPDGWDNLKKHLNRKGFTDTELYEADLVKKSSKGTYFDTFRNRLVFPVIDLRGNVIAFSGRRLNEEDRAKYVNSADTLVYKKGREIFGLNFAKKSNEDKLILCEGNIDVVMLHQAGFNNAVAALGTALTEEQAHLISRYASEVFLCYDSDEAGQKAVKKALNIFSRTTLRVKVINMKGGKDPDEIIKKYGVERFRSLITGAYNDIEYKLSAERQKYDLTTTDGVSQYIRAAAGVLSRAASPIEADVYASKLAGEFSVNKEALLSEVQKAKRRAVKTEKTEAFREIQKKIDDPNALINKINPERRKHLRCAKAEETIIATLMNNPEFYRTLKNRVSAEDFVTTFNKNVYSVISSRLSEDKPIDISFLASSFSDDEISVIARIQADTGLLSNSLAECKDCINVIKSEKDKKKTQLPSEMSDKDFLNIFSVNETQDNT